MAVSLIVCAWHAAFRAELLLFVIFAFAGITNKANGEPC